jgi:hypothetical protein
MRSAHEECEWNPATGTAANVDDPTHAAATISVGNGKWHLCAACADLPQFRRYKKTAMRRGSAHFFTDAPVLHMKDGWECANGHIHASGMDADRCEANPPSGRRETGAAR